ncbi:hypothetical protein ATCC90586_002235 [Pythium insidiosum]|nr:hypothetical protein ATCC90586_002235 [Pythium insidiosum]
MIDPLPLPINAFRDALETLRLSCRELHDHAAQLAQAPSGLPRDVDVRRQVDEIVVLATNLQTLLKHQQPPNKANGHAQSPPSGKRFDQLEPTATHGSADHWVASSSSPALSPSQPSVWSGFYNKTLRERFDVLSLMYPRLQRLKGDGASSGVLAPSSSTASSSSSSTSELSHPFTKLGELPVRTANLMIENCIGVLGIPLGLGLNFLIDGAHYSVPMAVEEPSVVAAASSAAKLVASFGGGFHTATSGNIMTSQIQLVDTPDVDAAQQAIAAHRERLLHLANTTLCPNMKKRGGGARDIYCRVVTQRARDAATRARRADPTHWYAPCPDELEIDASASDTAYLVVHIDVDVCEAMGANIVNTVAEGLSDEICRLTKSRCGLRILTNLCMQRRARATFEIPVAKLGWKGVDGEQVASRIVEAYNFAAIDPYRAVTHNKGIMNGVDAVAVATGQDWRAIEAAAHCFASRSGQYASLSRYEIVSTSDRGRVLRGSLELPIAVGSKGGALQTHPGYAATHAILRQPSARTLSGILVSVGLAQNFAAVRAIAVTGIQKGHMALHARNIAVAAGTPSGLVSEVCTYMLGRQSINVETATEYLRAHEVFSEIHSNSPPLSPQPETLPSMFYVEMPVPHLEGMISLNIAFESLNKHPQYIAIMSPSSSAASASASSTAGSGAASVEKAMALELQRQLLGDKGYNQLEKMFLFLSSMRSIVMAVAQVSTEHLDDRLARANLALQNKLQLLSVLINILVYRLMELRPAVVGPFLRNVFETCRSLGDLDARCCRALLASVSPSDDVLATGLPLLLALCQVLHYHLEQDVAHALIRERVAAEQWQLLHAVVESFALVQQDDAVTPNALNTEQALETFMATHAKRWQATMLLLVDSLALPSELVTPARLDVLGCIGAYMEWEGTVAHDVARYQRALTERLPNAFVYWMRLQGLDTTRGNELHAEFRRVTQLQSAKRLAEVAASASASVAAVERVTQLIRDVYAERGGQRARKDSF